MKRKIQIFLFILIMLFIVIIAIFVSEGAKQDNVLVEDAGGIKQDDILLENSDITMMQASVMSNIVLPPGSTSEDLQDAIYNATSGDTIIISDDIIYSSTSPSVIIPYGIEVTIQSDEGNNWVLSQSRSSIRHFTVEGTLNLRDITLEGATKGGGIRVSAEATFNMNTNTIIQNCYNYDGGAVITYGIFNMYEATITKCSSGNGGGVRCNANGEFNMYGGTITDNSSSIGGGVNIANLR